MTIRRLFMLVLILGLSPAASESQPPETAKAPEPTATKRPAAPPFLAIHHYNPASDEAHRKLLGFLAELNEAVARTGLAKTEYVAWQVTGKQSGDFGYVFGSLWPDRATYDAVHEHEVYKAVVARFMETGLEPFAAELYNRYILLNPPAGGAPPV